MAEPDLFTLLDPDRPEAWPDPQRFPRNAAGQQIGPQLLADLNADPNPLVISGYASLGQLIPWLADRYADPALRRGTVRLLLGNEPFSTNHRTLALDVRTFPAEVHDYWTDAGISLYLFGKVLAVLELLRTGHLQVRCPHPDSEDIHAKIYATATAVTLGSSNFTKHGLYHQGEGNARFCCATEPTRHTECWQTAEAFWQQGIDYAGEFSALLHELLQVIDWQDALARACAELLEGAWAETLLNPAYPDEVTLWPSQRQGIAQALWLLRSAGGVLIADATGSGKTRMGMHLLRAITRWQVQSGRGLSAPPVLICPPAVQEHWQAEQAQAYISVRLYAYSALSKAVDASDEQPEAVIDAIRRTPILAIDEGHNFINAGTRRTQKLLSHLADAVVIFTATPINRGPQDLLQIINLLGPDHWRDETLEYFKRFFRSFPAPRPLDDQEQALLRQEIQRFTVRRTKARLNQLIDEQPDAYCNQRGQRCRYPHHHPCTYSLGESAADVALADAIRQAAGQLKGVQNFQTTLTMSESQRPYATEEQYLESRLRSARALSQYAIAVALRSSRAALLERLQGTSVAVADYGLHVSKTEHSGNLLAKLHQMAGYPPATTLTVPLPDWLTDPDAHRAACEHDIALYETILAALRELSDGREAAKVDQLLTLHARHPLLIAFDSHLITLDLLGQRLRQAGRVRDVWIATGQNPAQKRQVRAALALGGSKQGIALCSDSMAEGINLQQASAVMHLDMPSVVRIAERLREAFKGLQNWPPLHQRIVACIVGIPESARSPFTRSQD